MKPYMFLFILFCWGIIWGNSYDIINASYVRQILRPLYLIIVTFTVKKLLGITKMNKEFLIMSILVSLCLAGLLGYYAMHDHGVSLKLIRLYVPDIEYNKYVNYTFDMSVRAMSVFSGYDQASVSYAFGCILAFTLTVNMKKGFKYKMIVVALVFILFGCIISSARIGFVSVLGGGLVLLLLPSRQSLNSKILLIFMALSLTVSLSHFVNIFPDSKTYIRFSDVLRIFSFNETNTFIERSEGLTGVVETQILDKTYPDGIDMVFGFGDDTMFVSDVAFSSTFIKYGFVGLFAVFYVYFSWIYLGVRMTIYGIRNNIHLGRRTVLFILPGVAVLFFIAAMKGPLYFLTLKTGELVSVFLGLVLFEQQSIMNRWVARRSMPPKRELNFVYSDPPAQ